MTNIEKGIDELKELLSKDQIDVDACRNILTRIEGDVIDIVDENDSYRDEVWDLERKVDDLEWELGEKESEIDKWSLKPEKATLNDEYKRDLFDELDKKYYSHWQLEKLLKEANII
jgi:predicted  nucleic acid-binding Zn-ribbon protein